MSVYKVGDGYYGALKLTGPTAAWLSAIFSLHPLDARELPSYYYP
jgi:hypothetical protein